jgi:hypothetical protein
MFVEQFLLSYQSAYPQFVLFLEILEVSMNAFCLWISSAVNHLAMRTDMKRRFELNRTCISLQTYQFILPLKQSLYLFTVGTIQASACPFLILAPRQSILL